MSDQSKRQEASIGRLIESKSRDITNRFPPWDSSWRAALARQMSLALQHVKQVRQEYAVTSKALREHDCELGSLVLSVKGRVPAYDSERPMEIERLREEQRRVQDARRHNRLVEQQALRDLHSALLTLINEYLVRSEGE